ncbi:hypothetical protein VNO77_19365 [Canavalia gladiata]|uniref:Uncharacterized protein n=1 Tax=Canavalia gladiata TaxID=3824 RepID=A0AAN9QIF3_CANGL
MANNGNMPQGLLELVCMWSLHMTLQTECEFGSHTVSRARLGSLIQLSSNERLQVSGNLDMDIIKSCVNTTELGSPLARYNEHETNLMRAEMVSTLDVLAFLHSAHLT